MEILSRIQTPPDAILNLLPTYGIVTPIPWYLKNCVQPVHIVSDLNVVQAQPVRTWVSAGVQTAPAGGTVLADTGPLAAGNWDFLVWLSSSDSNINLLSVQHRDAPNTGTVQVHNALYNVATELSAITLGPFGINLALNERLRVVVVNAVAATRQVQASILYRQIS